MSCTDKLKQRCGIYKITSPTGRIYIGQAVNLERRIKGYLTKSTSSNQPKLKNSFSKYGVENHQFDIIEYCSEEELNCSERFWQDEFEAISKKNLNCVLQNCGEVRKVYTEELRKKISDSKKGEKNPNWGKKISQEQIDKSNANRKCTKGKIISEKTKQKMKEKHYDCSRGNNSKAKITICLQTGIFYDCLKDACEVYELIYDNTKRKVREDRHKYLRYI